MLASRTRRLSLNMSLRKYRTLSRGTIPLTSSLQLELVKYT